MPGTAKVTVWNLALNHIGQRPIALDTEQSVMALACARVWDTARREVLRECPWGFATVFESLSAVSGYTPPLGWAYAYQYPAKAVAVRRIFAPGTSLDQTQFPMNQSSGNYRTPIRTAQGEKFREVFIPTKNVKALLSNTQDALAEFTWDVEDTTMFDASCITLLGYRLAADISTPLTGDSSIAVNLIKIYNSRLSEAQRFNSYEDNTTALGEADTVESRG